MNSLQDELNREIIGEHYSHPRHFCRLGDDALALENPSCGDKLKLALRPPAAGAALDICFEGSGCSISLASASMMAEILSGRTRAEALAAIDEVLAAFRGELPPETFEKYGDIAALSGVARLPVRVKCATLAWQGARRLLLGGGRAGESVGPATGGADAPPERR